MASAASLYNSRSSSSLTLLAVSGRLINEAVSFVVFILLDLLDFILCFLFKIADFLIEAEWKPCYCSSASSPNDAVITSTGNNILVSEQGESKVVCLPGNAWSTKLQLEDVSDTLYRRPYLVSEVSKLTVNELRVRLTVKQNNNNNNNASESDPIFATSASSTSATSTTTMKITTTTTTTTTSRTVIQSSPCEKKRITKNSNRRKLPFRSTFAVNSTIVEMLQGRNIETTSPSSSHPIPRWSDCYCKTCTSWVYTSKDSLYVHVDGAKDNSATEDVLFIHGFISSSKFWTETVFPNFSSSAKSKYRLLAVDLLGFGRSPKPAESLYTLREHLEMIEHSVLDRYKVKSFHIVAHSLGCILALALAVNHPSSIKSLTLLAPPYFPVPKGEQGAAQYVMRRVAPRRVWPPIALGASIACWYEHITRAGCLLVSKNHRYLEFILRLLTRNRMRTFMVEVFFCHTFNAAWHTLHNIICGTAGKLEGYIDAVRERLSCPVTIFHGSDDELLPTECSRSLQSRIPRAQVKVIDQKDHLTIVLGRQRAFARDLEQIWRRSSNYSPPTSDSSK